MTDRSRNDSSSQATNPCAIGGRATLVVVDMQTVFADPSSGWAADGFDEIRPRVERLVRRFEDRVVFTRFVAPARPDGAWRAYYEQWPWALQPPDAPLYRLVLDPGDHPVLDATTFGKWGPALAALVDDAIVLAGVSTDCCVLSTALATADAGVAVTVAADACAGASAEDHQRALCAMALYTPLIRIANTPELAKVSVRQ